jgi:hypothetical protein
VRSPGKVNSSSDSGLQKLSAVNSSIEMTH